MPRVPNLAIRRICVWLALAQIAVWLACLLPNLDLASTIATVVAWWTRSASLGGSVVIGLVLAVLLAVRGSASWRRRGQEALIHVVVLAIVVGGGALANEYVVKRSFATPRPHIVRLARENVLGMTPEQFYMSLDRQGRRTYLEAVLDDPGGDHVALTSAVRDHWIHEAGYSFPSGHALASMLLATYFVLLGAQSTGLRRSIFRLLPWWAVSVAWSRVLLDVHRPLDVAAGALLGLLLGWAAAVVAWRWLDRRRASVADGSGREANCGGRNPGG